MQKKKYKTINHHNITKNILSTPSNNSYLPSNITIFHHTKSAKNTIQQSFDFKSYLKQLQNGFRQSCRADIVNRRQLIKTMDNKRNSTKNEEKSSLLSFKKQIEYLQEDKQRWDHFDHKQIGDKKLVHSNPQLISKISTINIHSFQQIQHQQSLLNQFKNTFHKSMYNPLKATIQANLKRCHINLKKMKRKSSKNNNICGFCVQKQNEMKPIHSAGSCFIPFHKYRRQSNRKAQSKSCMTNENNILISRPAKMNTFQFQILN